MLTREEALKVVPYLNSLHKEDAKYLVLDLIKFFMVSDDEFKKKFLEAIMILGE